MNPNRDESKNGRTRYTFSQKWEENPTLFLKETLDENSEIQRWILKRNGWGSKNDLESALVDCPRILDAGCGNGRVSVLLAESAPHAEIVGIDLINVQTARNNNTAFDNTTFIQADLTEDLSHLGFFDFIYCQEVLHHTGAPKLAFNNLVSCLNDGGILAIYVYRKKAPGREFMDDYIREYLSVLPYEKAMQVCRQITEVGKVLSEIPGEIHLKDVPLLGIEEGTYSVQRFVYHFFLKCFWNPAVGFEESSVVNFDWYHPQNCTRHTMEEVLAWFGEQGLEVIHHHLDPYGITVHGKKS